MSQTKANGLLKEQSYNLLNINDGNPLKTKQSVSNPLNIQNYSMNNGEFLNLEVMDLDKQKALKEKSENEKKTIKENKKKFQELSKVDTNGIFKDETYDENGNEIKYKKRIKSSDGTLMFTNVGTFDKSGDVLKEITSDYVMINDIDASGKKTRTYYYKDGSKEVKVQNSGIESEKKYSPEGYLIKEFSRENKTTTEYNKDGSIKTILYHDKRTTDSSYYVYSADGSYKAYDKNNKLTKIKTINSDGSYTITNSENNVIETGNNGEYKHFYDNGNIRIGHSDGSYQEFDSEGTIVKQLNTDGSYREYGNDGSYTDWTTINKMRETYHQNSDGSYIKWDGNNYEIYDANGNFIKAGVEQN